MNSNKDSLHLDQLSWMSKIAVYTDVGIRLDQVGWRDRWTEIHHAEIASRHRTEIWNPTGTRWPEVAVDPLIRGDHHRPGDPVKSPALASFPLNYRQDTHSLPGSDEDKFRAENFIKF